MRGHCYWLLLLVSVGNLQAEIQLLATTKIAGTTSDRSGLTGKLADGTPRNTLGSMGSGIAYSGRDQRYVLIADRGPKDGATDYPCRWHMADIVVTTGRQPTIKFALVSTTLLRDERGQTLNGSTKALDPKKPMRFDPEAIRFGPEGTLFIADEYGPTVSEFNTDGQRLRSFTTPAKFQLTQPSAMPDEELPPTNTKGRQPNRGFEGLAISSDGQKLFALLQSPLIQDGALGLKNVRTGTFCRLLEIERRTGRTREYVYPLEQPDTKAGEILAINDHEFLVLEGDSGGGKEAKFKKIMHIDLREATDISAVATLSATKLPASIKPVGKKIFIDLLDPKHRLVGANFPSKVEGITFGPNLPDGRHLLLVTTDNDFLPDVATEIYAFAIDRTDLGKK